MRRALLLALFLVACTPPPSGRGLNTQALDTAIGQAIGDPTTCVLLADRASGKVVYRYGDDFNCSRQLPRCDGKGTLNAHDALQFAAAGRMASCFSLPDGSRSVGWVEGKVQSKTRDLVFSAVMEGQNALPGIEMNARLYDAFQSAGL
ncbi:MAG TPA: hypothetical protein VGL58_05745 [Caulobacteraceae bacterium]|jgi:hypothetical protein